ncbi:MAG: hypothetical protein ABJP70_03325 [Erythrobacter sp.]
MTQIDRRVALGAMIGAGALFAMPATAAQRLELPQSPMRLTRRLDREMGRGAKVVVTRDWSVQFAQQRSGIAISGEQTSVNVEAPESVAAFAELEEQRSTSGMFPFLLSENGLITKTGQYVEVYDEAKAIQMAQGKIQNSELSYESREGILLALGVLQSSFSSLLDQMPADLFFPASKPVKRVQTVDLQNGVTGEFELTYAALSSKQGAWLKHAERQVITRIGSDERRSREVWSMAPL